LPADRAKIATDAPRSTSISAVARPMPLDAPVTIATAVFEFLGRHIIRAAQATPKPAEVRKA